MDEAKKQSDISVITNLLENKFQRSDDFVHKENVKVYRNVQAVVVDELKRYTESAQEEKKRDQCKAWKGNEIQCDINACVYRQRGFVGAYGSRNYQIKGRRRWQKFRLNLEICFIPCRW